MEIPASNVFLPYVFGGAGAAGQDVTSSLTTSGIFTPAAESTALMYTVGGGVLIPVASRWVVDAAYRYSRIAADSTLSASPLSTNGMTFGLGYRF